MYVKYINKYKTIINKCKENYIKYNICKKNNYTKNKSLHIEG